jgi:glycosyltransferase involved in cell wall biosynthesis
MRQETLARSWECCPIVSPVSSTEPGGVSVVIPTKNRAELLRQTLRSVHEQSLAAVEVIVADDGSTDDTEDVARAAGARYVYNAAGDWGPSAARNAGMRAAESEYVSLIDSDDLLHPLALERLHEALDSRPETLFAFGQGLAAHRTAERWISEGIIGPRPAAFDDFLCNLYARNSIPSGGGLVRRSQALALGGFDESVVFAEDHAFWLLLALQCQPAYVPHIVCIHRRHLDNRWTPLLLAEEDPLISQAGERLAHCIPRRRGVQLCELSIDAIHRRSPRALIIAAKRLVRGQRRLEMLKSAASHLRERREGGRAGAALLAADIEFREWLATY